MLGATMGRIFSNMRFAEYLSTQIGFIRTGISGIRAWPGSLSPQGSERMSHTGTLLMMS